MKPHHAGLPPPFLPQPANGCSGREKDDRYPPPGRKHGSRRGAKFRSRRQRTLRPVLRFRTVCRCRRMRDRHRLSSRHRRSAQSAAGNVPPDMKTDYSGQNKPEAET
ncbi:MAG TPA: hypothetical protein DCW71_02735 [Alistipes sp.]|nr:hypothetical protein [Alistipes sp.]